MEEKSSERGQSASNRTPRQINRNLIFNQIRSRHPISRADLARISGLQRSTISIIVEGLLADEWIIECSVDETSRRGRRPTYLTVNGRLAVVAIDIHPARITIAIADLLGNISGEKILTLPDAPELVIPAVVNSISEALDTHSNHSFLGIGVTLPGRFSQQLGQAVFAPNVTWPIATIKSSLQDAIGLPVAVDNVANACALAEVWLGTHTGHRDLVVVNVSEGIGTGVYANGRVLRGASEGAGEFGHIQVDPNGARCNCGSRGCWETLASNRAAQRYYEERCGQSIATFDALIQLAQNGDEAALFAIHQMCKALGQGLHMIVCAVAPSEIVIVGEITKWWSFIAPLLDMELRRFPLIVMPILRISDDPARARLRSAVALIINERSLMV